MQNEQKECIVCGEYPDGCKCDSDIIDIATQCRLWKSRYTKLLGMNAVRRAELWDRIAQGEDANAIIDRYIP